MTPRSLTLLALLAATGTACDEVVDVEDLPPSVRLEAYCREGERTYVVVRIQDHERAPVDVDLVADLGGSTTRLPTGSTGDGLVGLSSERGAPGVVHRIEWGAPFEIARECGSGTCDATPCTNDACVRECAGLDPGRCIDTCGALERGADPLADVDVCTGRPETPPTTLRLTVYASDGENITSDEATLMLAPDCPDGT